MKLSLVGIGPKKKYPPILLLAFFSDKYDASLWMYCDPSASERRPVRSRFERKCGSTCWTGHAWQIRTKRLVGDQGALPKIERTSRALSLDGVEVAVNLSRCHSQIIAELPPLDLPLSGERYARNLLASALIETLGVVGVAFQRFLQAPFSFSIQHGQRTIMMRCRRRRGSERRRYAATCK